MSHPAGPDGISRRAFIAGAPALLFAPSILKANWRAPVHIALIYAPEYANAARAAEMSALEVKRAAALLKREFEFTTISAEADAPERAGWTAAIMAVPEGFAAVGTPVINIHNSVCSGDVLTLRPPRCQDDCVLWHHSLERYGAGQLNDRFKAAGITIDEQAWLGWFAVKLLWEAGVRDKNPRELSYDGHKGTGLRFNRHGVLVQPVYRMNTERTAVTEEIKPTDADEESQCR